MHNTLRVVHNEKVNQSRGLVMLMGSLISCVNWYASIILSCVESLESGRKLQSISPVM